MREEIGLFEAIYTMRAIRRFKPDPVPNAVLRKVLEAAGQAPSGGNRQPWRFVVIRSAEGKRRLRDLLQQAEARAEEARQTGADRRPRPGATTSGGSNAAEWMTSAPVLVLVCAQRPVSVGPWSVGPHGQTFPAVQNLLLAARGYGLGGTITTNFKWMDAEVRAWLGLPEEVDTTALIPLGYPEGSPGNRHGRKSRRPIEELTYEERWGQAVTF